MANQDQPTKRKRFPALFLLIAALVMLALFGWRIWQFDKRMVKVEKRWEKLATEVPGFVEDARGEHLRLKKAAEELAAAAEGETQPLQGKEEE